MRIAIAGRKQFRLLVPALQITEEVRVRCGPHRQRRAQSLRTDRIDRRLLQPYQFSRP
ncbi:hypothetical protein ACWCW2_42825 [Streptomyces sp. NPDC001773]|uniref:hypothetical protein n=1 Tax=Streptomyces sp. NPDC005499 TaxID=3154883 RepID=UPI0033AB9100